MSNVYRILPAGSRTPTPTHGAAQAAPTGNRKRRRPHPEATLVIPGPSQGGPRHLSGAVTGHVITAEQAGAHTVLLAAAPADLQTNVAAVCRYVVTDQDTVAQEAIAGYGAERVLRVRSAAADDVAEWVGRLPRPEAHTVRRRIRRAVRRLPFAQGAYDRIRSKR